MSNTLENYGNYGIAEVNRRNAETMRDRTIKLRQNKIVELCITAPRTIKQLVNEIEGTSTMTIHRDVSTLVEQDRLYIYDQVANGATRFAAGSDNETKEPTLINVATQTIHPLENLIQTTCKNDWRPTNGAKAADDFIPLLWSYLELCQLMATGAQKDEEEILALRNQFGELINRIDVIRSFCEQMVINKNRWTMDELKRIGSLDKYTYEALRPARLSFDKSRYFNKSTTTPVGDLESEPQATNTDATNNETTETHSSVADNETLMRIDAEEDA